MVIVYRSAHVCSLLATVCLGISWKAALLDRYDGEDVRERPYSWPTAFNDAAHPSTSPFLSLDVLHLPSSRDGYRPRTRFSLIPQYYETLPYERLGLPMEEGDSTPLSHQRTTAIECHNRQVLRIRRTSFSIWTCQMTNRRPFPRDEVVEIDWILVS